MSTVKKKAVSTLFRTRIALRDEDGETYRSINYLPREQQPQVGDHLYLARRLNNHHGQPAEWEIWPIVVEQLPGYEFPKTWYGRERYLMFKERK